MIILFIYSSQAKGSARSSAIMHVTHFQFHGTTFHLVLALFVSLHQKIWNRTPYLLTFWNAKHSHPWLWLRKFLPDEISGNLILFSWNFPENSRNDFSQPIPPHSAHPQCPVILLYETLALYKSLTYLHFSASLPFLYFFHLLSYSTIDGK